MAIAKRRARFTFSEAGAVARAAVDFLTATAGLFLILISQVLEALGLDEGLSFLLELLEVLAANALAMGTAVHARLYAFAVLLQTVGLAAGAKSLFNDNLRVAQSNLRSREACDQLAVRNGYHLFFQWCGSLRVTYLWQRLVVLGGASGLHSLSQDLDLRNLLTLLFGFRLSRLFVFMIGRLMVTRDLVHERASLECQVLIFLRLHAQMAVLLGV